MEGNRLSSNSSDESQYDENIINYLINYRNRENASEYCKNLDVDTDEALCADFISYLQKQIFNENGANSKNCWDCGQSHLVRKLNEEKMMLEEKNASLGEVESLDLKYATNERLLEEIDNVLTNSTSKAIFLKPQSSSSPKPTAMSEKNFHSNIKAKNTINSFEFSNDSLGYHTFKSNMASKYENKLITDTDLNAESSNDSPLVISISDDDIVFEETENLDTNLNPFQPKELNKKCQGKVSSAKKRNKPNRKQRRARRKLREQEQQKIDNQPDIEQNLQSEKRLKLNAQGRSVGINIQNISLVYEKRKNQPLKYKPIKFVSGGMLKFSTNSNFIAVEEQLKMHETNLENIEECKIKNILKGPGGQIMLKMGYELRKGLGKYSQGILQPIEAHIRKGRGSIGSYGSEMLLPTSVKVQELQYKILKSLYITDLQPNKNDSHFQPGIYSNVFFDYSTLPDPFDSQIENNYEYHNFNFSQNFFINLDSSITYSKSKSNIILSNNSNTFTGIENFGINNGENSRKLLKAKRRIKVQNNPLQLVVTTSSGRFNFEQFQKLKENLNTITINAALLHGISLQFEDIFMEEGYMKINCSNESTHYWIENLIRNSAYGQFIPNIKLLTKFYVHFDSIISSGYKMEIFIPGKSLKTADYLKLLEIQNPGLLTREWKIYKRNEIKNGVELIIEINEKSLNTLQNVYEFRPYLFLNRIQFHMIKDI
ncbi:uncharacterized protein LOC129608446 [Condylostylus longicornis]|uniref:uncharacterized protein LOC129608446 n=1 Tax=Condylostylus longicornis TaxID=2530218 RepID=UPI00244E527F|nr:uncharacterized protein LOC129608446 [Condylostylus longicornis]